MSWVSLCAGHPGRGGRQLTLTPTPSRYLPFLWASLLNGQQLPGQGQVPPLLGHSLARLEGMLRDARRGVGEGRGIEVLEGETPTAVSPWWKQIGRELRPSPGPGDPQVLPRRTLSGSQFLLREPLGDAGRRASLACQGPRGSLHGQHPKT